MEDGLLSLKWNNHKTTFFDILRSLREKSNYTDATIAVEGKFYPVHKLVMSTCSEYFSEIFERTPCKSPVIVLKDVRSQDMDALLDYMYLGEVNVNQNDLASLLKTAECLRIKGLAVHDEEPPKSRKSPSDERHNSPPPKRRCYEDQTRPVSPTSSGPAKTPMSSPAQPHPPPHSGSHGGDSIDNDPSPIVKVEMHENDEVYRQDNYVSGNEEGGGGDFGSDLSKTEHDPETYTTPFPGPSLQPGGDLAWDEGDSSSFPPEGFSGDVPPGQQPQGEISGLTYRQLQQLMEDSGRSDELSEYATVSEAAHIHTGNGNIHGMVGSATVPLAQSSFSQVMDSSGVPLPTSLVQLPLSRHPCPMCPKGFRSKLDMERHMRTHTGEKPFTCPYCTHRSATKGNLKTHMRHIHSNTLPGV
ncbi:hypothetical protein SK128_027108 [Halocaridina rubra]|uniref:Broad-complex n=1 Tax=Halocaridina rubra TaxID=373956 RepID=A0AAN9AES5_HALRR